MVDDSYPPATKELPQWGLRAEFWIEGIGQNYGNDTNDSGVYLRLSTDQVRFYKLDGNKLMFTSSKAPDPYTGQEIVHHVEFQRLPHSIYENEDEVDVAFVHGVVA